MTNITKNKRMILTIIAIVLLALLIYNNSSYYIKTRGWKTYSDISLGDWLDFRNNRGYYQLDYPKIYINGKHVGYVVFCLYDKLWIYKIKDDNDTGLGICEYISK